MAKDTVTLICTDCGFAFEVPPRLAGMQGCVAPPYCDKNQDNPNNRYKRHADKEIASS